ncbi:glycosyltransferase 87 family protein [Mycolicibacterium sp. 050158]|uniref:glycosyltransferase 87 family protein n=1 Tax=Mycolicibacterium sp. 050158 TaxID=3090602 RepID=UPI00299E87D3|nr:glycosyltransferase 87 family protein [Mycolicibacterium sp. 050158]MDX1891794.1 glycosyltransferase 87 family protein [Mycolicibacterium sp. 050158]
MSIAKRDQRANAWVRTFGPVILLVAVVAYVAMYLRWPSLAGQVDLLVYRFGASRVLAGQDLYSLGLTGNPRTLLFDYTPFAALCSLPLTWVSSSTVQVLGLIVNVGLMAYVVRRTLVRLGMSAAGGLWGLGALLMAMTCWLEPVRLSLQLGQVNLVILAVVVADVLGSDGRRWAGVGIGVVAGIKLVPALFIVYLVLTGRRRAAIVASATLAATVALGWLVLPRDSTYFWLRGGFDDVSRITSDPVANTSLTGLFVRLHVSGLPVTAATAVVAAVGLAVAVLAWRRRQAVLGVAIVGMTSAAASPFSWSHHWVWFVPLLVHLGHRAYVSGGRWSMAALWTGAVLFAGWVVATTGDTPETGLLSLREGGTWNVAIPAAYLVAFAGVLAGTAWWLTRTYDTGTTTGEPLYPVTRTQPAVSDPLGADARTSTVSPG